MDEQQKITDQPNKKEPQGSANPRQDIEDNKILAVISYFGVLCLIPLFGKKDSRFAQFHAKQGLVLLIAWIIASFVNVIPFFGYQLWRLLALGFFIIAVFGIIKAWQGEYWELPVLGQYAKKIKI